MEPDTRRAKKFEIEYCESDQDRVECGMFSCIKFGFEMFEISYFQNSRNLECIWKYRKLDQPIS